MSNFLDLQGEVALTHGILKIKVFFYQPISDYSILERLKEIERKWKLHAGRFFYFRLCTTEATIEDLLSSGAQFSYSLRWKTDPAGLQSYIDLERIKSELFSMHRLKQ